MPHYVVEKLQLALNERGKAVKGSQVLVLGLAYKKDIDDPRESPAFEILEALLELGAEVCYHDPHVATAPRTRSWPDLPAMESQPLTRELLEEQDAVLLVTDHTAVDYALVARHAPLVVDTRGVYRQPLANVVKAVGRGRCARSNDLNTPSRNSSSGGSSSWARPFRRRFRTGNGSKSARDSAWRPIRSSASPPPRPVFVR